mmetsp:Transcript_7931/g.14375  ORF Transcript_7931/g.14375 Transcript_7931/m.14375 type:complete len:483 (-) Transcript_7931:4-1452(-)
MSRFSCSTKQWKFLKDVDTSLTQISSYSSVFTRYCSNTSFLRGLQAGFANKQLQLDRSQLDAALTLEKSYKYLVSNQANLAKSVSSSRYTFKSTLQSFFRSNESSSFKNASSQPQMNAQKGVYLFGGVGCGKTMLMDMFYEMIPSEISKRREHFHEFMLEFHSLIHELRMQQHEPFKKNGQTRSSIVPFSLGKTRQIDDPVVQVAQDLSSECSVLCLDEFQVTDIADAVVLRRLFSRLFEYHGLILIATSNRAPEDLYKNGIQRELFTPFIPILRKHCFIHDMNSHTDYRLSGERNHKVFWYSQDGNERVEELFQKLCGQQPEEEQSIRVELGRKLRVRRASRGSALFSFDELCERPLSATDYLALCQNFHTLCLTNIPKLRVITQRNATRRFVTLLDELYEHRVKLVCAASAPAEDLFDLEGYSGDKSTAPDELFAADRAVSRLLEMQSELYLKSPWRHESRQSQAFSGINSFAPSIGINQ